jgi:hypothetical protein
MPYVIRPKGALAAIVGCAALLLSNAPAQAASISSLASSCQAPVLSRSLLSAGDPNYYFMLAGESADNFQGTGWALSKGASIKRVALADGSVGSVLDLPSGAKAVSPIVCVTSEYPSARLMEHNISGNAGVELYVSYWGGNTWSARYGGQARVTGQSWKLSEPLAMSPSKKGSWQLAHVELVGAGNAGRSELYDLYVDPYSR